MELLLVVAVLTLFGMAAQAWGADSRQFSLDDREPAWHPGLA